MFPTPKVFEILLAYFIRQLFLNISFTKGVSFHSIPTKARKRVASNSKRRKHFSIASFYKCFFKVNGAI